MEVHDKYILYTPPALPLESESAAGPQLTRDAWQKELTRWLDLFDDRVAFSPVKGEGATRESAGAPRSEGAAPAAGVVAVSAEEAGNAVQSRSGSVLASGGIVKFDQYQDIHSGKLQSGKSPQPLVEGAPNYRDVKGITGTGQPTVAAMREILDGKDGKSTPVTWVNLREEPVVYINGKPFNLRKASDSARNLASPGTRAKDLEKTELQLKKDIQAEAARNGGYFLIHDEVKDANGKYVTVAASVRLEDVRTPAEVYASLKDEGYKVDYHRVPISDEKAPEKADFDDLVKILKNQDPEAPLVMNCQAGKGRTTTAMVIAEMMKDAKLSTTGKKKSILKFKTVRNDIKEVEERIEQAKKFGQLKNILTMVNTLEDFSKKKDTLGEKDYAAAVGRLNTLLDGTAGDDRSRADKVMDETSHVQDLRKSAIDSLRTLKDGSPADKQKATDFMQRYFLLIAFEAYAKEQAESGFQKPFSSWIEQNPQLTQVLGNVQLALGMAPRLFGLPIAFA